MAVLKCKMCGGDLIAVEGKTTAECEYCGTVQTIPNADNEKKLNLFNRANRLRLNSEFDKAAAIYETIVGEFPEEAEGYWGLVICNYGIEYVDDPATGNKIPTCHRASFESVLKDENYALAMEYADVVAQKVYRDEAREIDRIREEILAVSKKEPPYDIFICYKETAEDGNRTVDSVLAQEVYETLTGKGYRVFFSRISLEDKLGVQYEPYIFAALTSAKIMLAFGTKYEYYQAVWVKNEWSRFLKTMAKDKTKALIPCYKDMVPGDLPDEFRPLQAQDMGKVGAIQDLMRGVEKILPKNVPTPAHVPAFAPVAGGEGKADVGNLLKRAFMYLEDGDWNSANEYCEKVLDKDAECARAYFGILLSKLKIRSANELKGGKDIISSDSNYKKALRFAEESFKADLSEVIYARSNKLMAEDNPSLLAEAQSLLESIHPYKDTYSKIEEVKHGLKKKSAHASELRKKYSKASLTNPVAISSSYALYLTPKNTVESATARWSIGEAYCQVGHWQNVTSVAAGSGVSFALQSNGTVLSEGKPFIFSNVKGWRDIVAISIYDDTLLGLKSNGTVVWAGQAYGDESSIDDWRNIVAIANGCTHSVGLKDDGTVVAVGKNGNGQCDVKAWSDIVAIAAGHKHTVGIKSDGTVVVTDVDARHKEQIEQWTDIIAVAAGSSHTIGLKSDGTVVAAGDNQYNQCDVSGVQDVVALAAQGNVSAYIKSDNRVILKGISLGEKSIGQSITNLSYYGEVLLPYPRTDKMIIKQKEVKYNEACRIKTAATSSKQYKQAEAVFSELGDYKSSADYAKECRELAIEADYNKAVALLKGAKGKNDLNTIEEMFSVEANLEEAAAIFAKIRAYKDSAVLEKECLDERSRLMQKRKQKEAKAQHKAKQKQIIKKTLKIVVPIIIIVGIIVGIFTAISLSASDATFHDGNGGIYEPGDDGYTLVEYDPITYNVNVRGVIENGIIFTEEVPVIAIGDKAFMKTKDNNNDRIETIILPDTIKSIGAQAFIGCSDLNAITICKGVESIGANAFDGCSSLTLIKFTGTKEEWNSIEKGTAWISAAVTIECSDGSIVIE